jgi:hypothetical protein
MNIPAPAVIQDTSRGAMKHQPIDGMVQSTFLLPSQREMVDGLVLDTSTRSGMAERRPIRAEGSYVGAPAMPKGSQIKAYAPATKTAKGVRMPVGQN